MSGIILRSIGALATLLIVCEAQAATVTFDVHDAAVAPGETFSIEIIGTGFNDGTLDGWGLDVGFDGSIVSADSSIVDPGEWDLAVLNGMITANSIDAIAGLAIKDQTGNILLATVTFTAGQSLGTTSLSLSEWAGNPFASGGAPYPNLALDQTASIVITSVPIPGAGWLLMSGVFTMGWLRRKTQV